MHMTTFAAPLSIATLQIPTTEMKRDKICVVSP